MSNTVLKKASKLLVGSLAAILVIGAFGTSYAVDNFSAGLEASVIQQKKIVRIKKVNTKLAQTTAANGEKPVMCELEKQSAENYRGEVISQNISVDAQPGETFKVSIFVKNVGSAPWFNDASGCTNSPIVHLGTSREKDRNSVFYTPGDKSWANQHRIKMVEKRVNPGKIATFTIMAKAPKTQDTFKEYFNVVVEGVKWLDSTLETTALMVNVGEVNDSNIRRAKLLNWSAQSSVLPENAAIEVHVDLGDQLATVMVGDKVVREYKTSTGAYNTPTPTGRFKILSKQDLRVGSKAPHYRMPYFQQVTQGFVGFHALPYLERDNGVFWKEALNHIGQRVSHGCVRMLPEDASDLFALTEVGTPVVIHY